MCYAAWWIGLHINMLDRPNGLCSVCTYKGSQFDVSADVTPEVLEALKAQCSSPVLAPTAAPEPYPDAFDAARLLIQEDILRGR